MKTSAMKTSTLITGLLAVLLLAPAGAVADHHGDHGKRMEQMAKRLQLSDAQAEEWRALHEAHHPRMQEIREEMREQQAALREASRDGFDEAGAEAAAARLGELTRESSLMKARMHAELRATLNEEQRARFDKHHMKGKKGEHGRADKKRGKERGEKRRERGGERN